MSLYVTCQCGQAFSAPEELAGQTLPCPMCQRPIAVTAAKVPLVAPPPGVPSPFGNQGAFQPLPSMPAPLQQPVARGEDDSPPVVWLSVIGGGLALVVVIGLIVYNATRRPAPQVATAPTNATANATTTEQAASLPAPTAAPVAPAGPVLQPMQTPMPPPPAAATTTIPVVAQLPAANSPASAPAEQANSFTPPGYGGMVATPDGKYEFWLPSAPQKFDPALDLAAFLPKPKGAEAMIAFGKDGPTEMCCVSITPGATAADLYAQMEKAFAGQPEVKTIKYAGVDARQYDFFVEITEGKFAIRAIAFALDGNGYTLQTLSITGQKETDETRAFFASFRKKKSDK